MSTLVLFANQARSVFYRYGNAADFIFSSLYPCWTWGNTILVIKPILGAAGWEPHGSSPTHTRGRQIRSYPLLLVCPRHAPNIWCKFSHTSLDLLIQSGQVKKCFSFGEWASGRKKSVVNSLYLKERHGAYCFSTLSCESYLRAALLGLNHGNSKGCRGTYLCPTNTHFNTHTLLLLTIYIYIKSISARK